MNFKKSITLLLLSTLSTYAQSNKFFQQLFDICDKESLTAKQAMERNEWALSCGHIEPHFARDILDYGIVPVHAIRSVSYPLVIRIESHGIVHDGLSTKISSSCNIGKNMVIGSCKSLAFTLEDKKLYALYRNKPARQLSYTQAIERIKWASDCSHLGDRDDFVLRDQVKELLLTAGGAVKKTIRYPVFKHRNHYRKILAPTDRETRCDHGAYEIAYYKESKPSTCAQKRFQALHEGLITELEYEDLKTKHKAPKSLDNLRPVTCDE